MLKACTTIIAIHRLLIAYILCIKILAFPGYTPAKYGLFSVYFVDSLSIFLQNHTLMPIFEA